MCASASLGASKLRYRLLAGTRRRICSQTEPFNGTRQSDQDTPREQEDDWFSRPTGHLNSNRCHTGRDGGVVVRERGSRRTRH
jgi:hypothetical protein